MALRLANQGTMRQARNRDTLTLKQLKCYQVFLAKQMPTVIFISGFSLKKNIYIRKTVIDFSAMCEKSKAFVQIPCIDLYQKEIKSAFVNNV